MNSGRQVFSRIRLTWQAACQAASAAWVRSGQATAGQPCDLSEVLAHSADAVIQADETGRIHYINEAARQVLGLAPQASTDGLNFLQFAASGARRQFARAILPDLQARGVWVGETALRLGARNKVPFSLMAVAHRDAQGRAVRFSAVMRDISEDMRARKQIQRQNDILGAITEALPATVVIVDSQGLYRFVNSAFTRYVGLDADQILGRNAIEVLGKDEVMRRKPFMQKAIAGEAVDFVLDYPGEQGTTYLALHCIPLKLDGVVDGFVGISQDITPQRREQARLADLAERDPLTGLLNRAGLDLRMQNRLWAGERNELALLYIDLDHFKPVNDQMGHQAGDVLLQMFAQRMLEAVRSSDVVARMGGDEFAILLSGVRDLATAEVVAGKVLAAARLPFDIGGLPVRVSASIGVAVMAHGDADLHALMSRADALLYRAKSAGRGQQCSDAAALSAPHSAEQVA